MDGACGIRARECTSPALQGNAAPVRSAKKISSAFVASWLIILAGLHGADAGCTAVVDTAVQKYADANNTIEGFNTAHLLYTLTANYTLDWVTNQWDGEAADCGSICAATPGCLKAVYLDIVTCGIILFDAVEYPRAGSTVLKNCVLDAPPLLPPVAKPTSPLPPMQPSPTQPPPEPMPAPPPSNPGSAPVLGAVVGGIVGGVALLALLVVGIVLRHRTKRRLSHEAYSKQVQDSVSQLPPTPDKIFGRPARDPRDPDPPLATPLSEYGDAAYSAQYDAPAVPLPHLSAAPNTLANLDSNTMTGRATVSLLVSSVAKPAGSSLATDTGGMDFIEAQLDSLFKSGGLVNGRYRVGDRSERRLGGQAVVQFATHANDAKKQYAIKFFLDKAAFAAEESHFCNPALHHILPSVDAIVHESANAALVLGRPLPPMVVVERGESLNEWQRRCPADFVSCMQIMVHLAQRAVDMHAADVVHRDLKPANVILYPATNSWTFIDFGIAAPAGSLVPSACTLAYAAPEVVQAGMRGEKHVLADKAVDVWSLGVMAWELFTRSRVFSSADRELVEAAMTGRQLLPWEATDAQDYAANRRKLGWMLESVLRMLDRDPATRITIAEALRTWKRFLQNDTTAI